MPAADTVYTEWHFWNFDYIWDVRQDFATSVSKERHGRRLSEVGVYMDSLCFFCCVEKLRAAGGKEGKKYCIILFHESKLTDTCFICLFDLQNTVHMILKVFCVFSFLFLSLSTLFDTLLYNVWTTHI